MGHTKKMIFTAVIFLSLSIACIAVFYAQIAAFIFARSNNIDISYRQAIAGGFTEFIFKDLKAARHDQGIGLSSSGASIKLVFDKPSPLEATADFVLSDVRFIKKGSGKEISYNNIDDLLAAPFSGLLKYKTVSGKISMIKNGISLKDFLASGDEIRFSFDGTLTNGNIINADITIYFAKGLSGKIPAELTSMALKGEADGWKSLALKLEGDLSKPSIKVTGKLFRLNIGVKQ
ncbi:MAG: hypothetical protein NTY76_03775 [Candidatus Omnitrophica bacterium]|nr:hypothetical protein [Candidatus Omnitrophota bacterium]